MANAAEFSDMMAKEKGGAAMGTSSMSRTFCGIIRWGVSPMAQAIRRLYRLRFHRRETGEIRTGVGMDLAAGCHGVPVLYHGAESNAVIWRVVSCQNFPSVRMV